MRSNSKEGEKRKRKRTGFCFVSFLVSDSDIMVVPCTERRRRRRRRLSFCLVNTYKVFPARARWKGKTGSTRSTRLLLTDCVGKTAKTNRDIDWERERDSKKMHTIGEREREIRKGASSFIPTLIKLSVGTLTRWQRALDAITPPSLLSDLVINFSSTFFLLFYLCPGVLSLFRLLYGVPSWSNNVYSLNSIEGRKTVAARRL